jgi:hypothetical protein
MKTLFEYPLSVKVGDEVVIVDTEEHKTYVEKVESVPERQGEKVSMWTNKRLLFCDPGLKIQIRRKVDAE